jgi:DNA-binding HxlR family transcriptional regulator
LCGTYKKVRNEQDERRIDQQLQSQVFDYLRYDLRRSDYWRPLDKRPLRYGELKKNLSQISERMLTLQLRELEADGMLTRTVFAEVPPRVEYELTAIGKALVPICLELSDWGTKHRALVVSQLEGSPVAS